MVPCLGFGQRDLAECPKQSTQDRGSARLGSALSNKGQVTEVHRGGESSGNLSGKLFLGPRKQKEPKVNPGRGLLCRQSTACIRPPLAQPMAPQPFCLAFPPLHFRLHSPAFLLGRSSPCHKLQHNSPTGCCCLRLHFRDVWPAPSPAWCLPPHNSSLNTHGLLARHLSSLCSPQISHLSQKPTLTTPDLSAGFSPASHKRARPEHDKNVSADQPEASCKPKSTAASPGLQSWISLVRRCRRHISKGNQWGCPYLPFTLLPEKSHVMLLRRKTETLDITKLTPLHSNKNQ